MAKLIHEDATSCSFDGQVYEVGDDGAFDVPAAAVGPLASHGFILAPEPTPEPTPEPAELPAPAKKKKG